MQVNVGKIDRIIRIVIGIALLYAGIMGMVTGAMFYAAIVIGLILLVTGILGVCLVYSILKMSTAPKAPKAGKAS